MTVSVLRPGPGIAGVRLELSECQPALPDAAVELRWADLLRGNPRLFDGPILSLESLDLGAGVLRCWRDGYKRLAVQPEVPTGVELVSVTGVLTARDAAGREHILLGRRGDQTRVYGGMWELAPSGGIDPPTEGETGLEWGGVIAQLESELSSETGLAEPIRDPVLLCVLRDSHAFSADVAVRARFDGPVESLRPARENWEYAECRWVPVVEIRAFAASEPMVATALAALDVLGW
jgi:hypothetical protein